MKIYEVLENIMCYMALLLYFTCGIVLTSFMGLVAVEIIKTIFRKIHAC